MKMVVASLIAVLAADVVASRLVAGGGAELAVDVDGDGRADVVRLAAHEDGVWLDAALAARDFAPASSTRVGDGRSAARWQLGADSAAGAVFVRDAAGRVTVWARDGIAFAPAAAATPRSFVSVAVGGAFRH